MQWWVCHSLLLHVPRLCCLFSLQCSRWMYKMYLSWTRNWIHFIMDVLLIDHLMVEECVIVSLAVMKRWITNDCVVVAYATLPSCVPCIFAAAPISALRCRVCAPGFETSTTCNACEQKSGLHILTMINSDVISMLLGGQLFLSVSANPVSFVIRIATFHVSCLEDMLYFQWIV